VLAPSTIRWLLPALLGARVASAQEPEPPPVDPPTEAEPAASPADGAEAGADPVEGAKPAPDQRARPDSIPDAGFVPPSFAGDLPAVPYPADGDGLPHAVELRLVVGTDGAVIELEVVAGEPPYSEAALQAAAALQFVPAYEDGVPVEVELPFTWTLVPPVDNLVLLLRGRGDDAPLPGAELTVGGQRAITDADGRVSLRVPPGEVVISLTDDAWVLPQTAISVAANELVEAELWALQRRGDNEAVAVYTRDPEPVIKRSITAEDIRISPGTMGDPVRALQNQPGVLRTPLEAGWVLVRGGGVDDTAVFIDGVQVPLLFHLGGFTSVVHPEMVRSVELYPNAYPSRLGNGTAGAVEIVPRPAGADERSVAGFNLIYANAFTEVPIGDGGGLALAARRSYLDGVLALVLDSERAAIAPRFWDWQARLDTEHVDLMFIGMSDTIDAPTGNGDETVKVTQSGNFLVGGVHLDAGDHTQVLVRPWLSQTRHDIETELLDEQESVITPGLRTEVVTELPSSARVTLGAEARSIRYEVTRADLGLTNWLTAGAPYGELAVGEQVQATLGVRADAWWVPDQLPRVGFSPRGSLRWQATNRFAVVTEVGQYHQAPPLVLMAGLPSGAYLGLERSVSPSAGVRYTSPHFAADADVYTRTTERIAQYEADGTLTEGEARAWGVETWMRMSVGRFDARAIYQLSRSLYRDEPGQLFEPYRYDQPHRLLLLGLVSLPKQWSVASRLRYNTAFPIDAGATNAFDILTQEEVYFNDGDTRLQDFVALDLKVAKRFTGERLQIDVYLDVQNVTSRRVAEPVINGFDDSEAVYGYGLPTLPIFGVDATLGGS
jgi:hypothetical protein